MFNVTLTCNRLCWRLGVHIVRNGGNGFAPYSKTLMPMLVPTKYPWGSVRVAGPEGLRDHLLPACEDESPWLHHCPHGTCQEVSQGLRSISWGSYLPSSGNRAEEVLALQSPRSHCSFPFDGNKGDRATWEAGAYPALSWNTQHMAGTNNWGWGH